MKTKIIRIPATVIVTLGSIAMVTLLFPLLVIGLLTASLNEVIKICKSSLKASGHKGQIPAHKKQAEIKLSANEALVLSHLQITLGVSFTFLLLTSCVSYKSITQTDPSTNQMKISTALVPGNVVRITMKNGEVIKKMKVKEIDSVKISGKETIET